MACVWSRIWGTFVLGAGGALLLFLFWGGGCSPEEKNKDGGEDSGPPVGALQGEVSYTVRNAYIDTNSQEEKDAGEGLGVQEPVSSTKLTRCVWDEQEKLTLEFKRYPKSPHNGASYNDFTIEKLPFGPTHLKYEFFAGEEKALCGRTTYLGDGVGVCTNWSNALISPQCYLTVKEGSFREYKNHEKKPVIDFEATFYCKEMSAEVDLAGKGPLVVHLATKEKPGKLVIKGCQDGRVQ